MKGTESEWIPLRVGILNGQSRVNVDMKEGSDFPFVISHLSFVIERGVDLVTTHFEKLSSRQSDDK